MTRTFEAGPARRERTLVSVGIIGPSGSGKTKSALRLADGMARVSGGETWLIDTNNRRSLHHAAEHKFTVLHMPPPYSPGDYGAAFQHAISAGARRIIVDSISDEWEGEGGVLDMFSVELDRRSKGRDDERDRNNMAAWIVPKREHNRLRLWMFQQPVDWVLTFRAKEKIKPVKGKQPEDMGWQPLGADDLIYELLVKCLLRPQADGKPIWTSDVMHERVMMKLPGWFRQLFADSPVLSEDVGEQLARWSEGADVVAQARHAARPPAAPGLAERLDQCSARDELVELDREMRSTWQSIPPGARAGVTEAYDRAKDRVRSAGQTSHATKEST